MQYFSIPTLYVGILGFRYSQNTIGFKMILVWGLDTMQLQKQIKMSEIASFFATNYSQNNVASVCNME